MVHCIFKFTARRFSQLLWLSGLGSFGAAKINRHELQIQWLYYYKRFVASWADGVPSEVQQTGRAPGILTQGMLKPVAVRTDLIHCQVQVNKAIQVSMSWAPAFGVKALLDDAMLQRRVKSLSTRLLSLAGI